MTYLLLSFLLVGVRIFFLLLDDHFAAHTADSQAMVVGGHPTLWEVERRTQGTGRTETDISPVMTAEASGQRQSRCGHRRDLMSIKGIILRELRKFKPSSTVLLVVVTWYLNADATKAMSHSRDESQKDPSVPPSFSRKGSRGGADATCGAVPGATLLSRPSQKFLEQPCTNTSFHIPSFARFSCPLPCIKMHAKTIVRRSPDADCAKRQAYRRGAQPSKSTHLTIQTHRSAPPTLVYRSARAWQPGKLCATCLRRQIGNEQGSSESVYEFA